MVARMLSKSKSSIALSTVSRTRTAALLMSKSRPPKSLAASREAAATDSSSVTSGRTGGQRRSLPRLQNGDFRGIPAHAAQTLSPAARHARTRESPVPPAPEMNTFLIGELPMTVT